MTTTRISRRLGGVLAGLAAGLALLAAARDAPASTPFQLAVGKEPNLAVDGAGTAHIAWFDRAAQTVEYCRIPRDKRACEGRQTLFSGQMFGRPHVLLPAPGQVLIVLGEAQCGRTDACTFIRRSSDGGTTFAPALPIADPEGPGSLTGPATSGDLVYGPGNSLSFVNDMAAGGIYFTNAPLSGTIEHGFARLSPGGATDGTVGLAGDRPVVVWNDLKTPRAVW